MSRFVGGWTSVDSAFYLAMSVGIGVLLGLAAVGATFDLRAWCAVGAAVIAACVARTVTEINGGLR